MDFELSSGMLVVENDDPRVIYSHGWKRILGEDRLCSGDSYHRTYIKGASARFEFEGSHIWIIGHQSASHGKMKINIDGRPEIATINAWGKAPELVPFRNLFTHEFAESGRHWVEVVNDLSGSEITVDFFAYRPMSPGRTWEVPRGLKLVTIADNDPRMEYSGYWEQISKDKNGVHHGGSCHYATASGATASVSFESTHVWIIGDCSDYRGRYGVSVDGGVFEEFSGYESHWRGFAIKYERRFANLGPHRMVIRNEENNGFALDAVIYEAPTSSFLNASAGLAGEKTERGT